MATDAWDQSLWAERERALPQLLTGGEVESTALRTEIQDSWRRCAMTGITPGTSDVPYAQDLPEDSRLRRAAGPVIRRLSEQLMEAPATILLADSAARIVDRSAGGDALRARLDNAHVAPGFEYAEESSGTNGIGTALEERRLFAVRGGEHFRESLQNLACVGKPIVHPVGRAVEGILDITCDVTDANALMGPLVEAAVREIEQRLYEMASREERAMLEAFLRTSRRGTAVVTLNNDLIMTNPAASRLLQPADQTLLWNWACLGLEKRDEFIGEVQLASKADVMAKARRLEDGTRTMGVVVELRTKPQPHGPRSAGTTRTATRRTTARLPGRAKATRALDAEIDLVAQDPGPTLITGELGVGKRHAAAILHRRWSADAEMVELSLLALDDVRSRLAEVGEQLTSGTTVVLRHVHALAESDMGTLVALIEQASDTAGRLVVTGPDVPEPRAARVYAHFGRRIGVTPLASRTEEIEDIANEVLAQRAGRNGPQRLQAATLQSLMARSWPGNVRELVSVIESAASRALGGDIGLQHLPAGYRDSRPSRAHSALERAELETLLTVLKDSGGNKSLAAQRLGVARSTLYRKVREYGIDTDRFVNP